MYPQKNQSERRCVAARRASVRVRSSLMLPLLPFPFRQTQLPLIVNLTLVKSYKFSLCNKPKTSRPSRSALANVTIIGIS